MGLLSMTLCAAHIMAHLKTIRSRLLCVSGLRCPSSEHPHVRFLYLLFVAGWGTLPCSAEAVTEGAHYIWMFYDCPNAMLTVPLWTAVVSLYLLICFASIEPHSGHPFSPFD